MNTIRGDHIGDRHESIYDEINNLEVAVIERVRKATAAQTISDSARPVATVMDDDPNLLEEPGKTAPEAMPCAHYFTPSGEPDTDYPSEQLDWGLDESEL